MAVTLHSPLGGKDRDDSYAGPDEDNVVQGGYARRADGKVVSGQAKNDQMLAENREAPGEEPPKPKGKVVTAEDHPDVYKAPDVPEATDSTQPNQKVIDAKWEGVEKGERDPNNPDVVLADALKAIQESREYDGTPDAEVLKRQEAEAKKVADRQAKTQTEASKAANKAEDERLKREQLGSHNPGVVPDEDKRGEHGIRTDASSATLKAGGKYDEADTSKKFDPKHEERLTSRIEARRR